MLTSQIDGHFETDYSNDMSQLEDAEIMCACITSWVCVTYETTVWQYIY